MGAPLTERQKQILDFIVDFRGRRGVSPTHREICEHFGFASYGTAHKHLSLLERKGYLRRDRHQKRGVSLAGGASAGEPPAEVELPFLGRIAAGRPLEALPVPESISLPGHLLGSRRGGHYVLEVTGNSMIGEGIHDGDLILVREREDADPGEMVVALVGDEATLKRIYPEGETVRLEPANPEIPSLRVAAAEVRVQGVVVGLIRKF